MTHSLDDCPQRQKSGGVKNICEKNEYSTFTGGDHESVELQPNNLASRLYCYDKIMSVLSAFSPNLVLKLLSARKLEIYP